MADTAVVCADALLPMKESSRAAAAAKGRRRVFFENSNGLAIAMFCIVFSMVLLGLISKTDANGRQSSGEGNGEGRTEFFLGEKAVAIYKRYLF